MSFQRHKNTIKGTYIAIYVLFKLFKSIYDIGTPGQVVAYEDQTDFAQLLCLAPRKHVVEATLSLYRSPGVFGQLLALFVVVLILVYPFGILLHQGGIFASVNVATIFLTGGPITLHRTDFAGSYVIVALKPVCRLISFAAVRVQGAIGSECFSCRTGLKCRIHYLCRSVLSVCFWHLPTPVHCSPSG